MKDTKELTEEEIRLLQEKYIDMFERIKALNSKEKAELEAMIGDYASQVNSIEMTPFGKILFLAKKVLVNSAITFVTGIPPMFLDKGLDDNAISERRRARYRKADQHLLAYSITKELEEGIDKTLELLRESNVEKLKDTLKKFHDIYIYMKKENYIIGEKPCYCTYIAYLMLEYLKTIKASTFDKIDALVSNKYGLGLTVNLPMEIFEAEDMVYGNNAKMK